MANRDELLLERLRGMFAIEAEEHLAAISVGLLDLEKGPTDSERAKIVETTFRKAHTLKGAARAVNLTTIVRLCHDLESTFADLSRQRIALSPALLDLLHQGFAMVKEFLPLTEEEIPSERQTALEALLQRLAAAQSPTTQEASPSVAPPPPAPAVPPDPPSPVATPTRSGPRDTIRTSTAKLDALLHQAEELIAVKLTSRQRATDAGELVSEFLALTKVRERMRRQVTSWRERGERQDIAVQRRNDDVAKLFELAQWDDQLLRWLLPRVSALAADTRRDLRSTNKMVDSLLDDAKQVLMVPFSALFEPIPQLVRDLSRSQGKDIDLVIHGEALEIDRRVQEEVKEALLHIIRNAIDHGIEPPEQRAGKPARGTLAITVTQKDAAKVEIAITDDGAGIDLAKIREAAAAQAGTLGKSDSVLSDQEATALIFRSGFSTSSRLTDVSGRGLGLAIVAEKIESLAGAVTVESRRGIGTTFRLLLPMTMASFRGVLVRSQRATFIIPITHVERVARIPTTEVKRVENKETIRIAGNTLSLVRLSDALGQPDEGIEEAQTGHRTAIVVMAGDRRIAFEVDAVLAEQEVLMKGLGWQLARVPNVAGATILGTGQLALILNARDLLASAATASATARQRPVLPKTTASDKRKAILVVEDSITARTLFKHVLEAAGFLVNTAVDGLDGWAKLEAEDYALVVSDIEMPRMGGIDLTGKIRQHDRYADLPVILISSLDSREDRERGMDAGANAYIVKKSFDQSDLLDIVRRLI